MTKAGRPARWWATLVAFVACLGLIGYALVSYLHPAYRTPTSLGRVPPVAATSQPAATGASASATSAPTSAASEPSSTAVPPSTTPGLSVGVVPTSLSLPALHISASVVPEGVVPPGASDPLAGAPGTLQIPDDPRILAWWQDGATAGSATGTVVLAGHVDTAAEGDGALFDLSSAALGQTITLGTAGPSINYHIVARETYVKAALPPSIFSTSGAPRLVVITCGGPFDPFTHHYADNVVVYAVPD